MVKLFEGAKENKGYVLKASLLVLGFWFLQFLYQFYVLIPGEFNGSLIRAFALSGATLIGLALIIGPLSKLSKINFVEHRRSIGVWGFTFILMHILSVLTFLFSFDIAALLFELNPFMNPLIFGIIAFFLFIPMYLTSTDWAVQKLGFKKWKFLHRLVYFAFIAAILHFVQINPELLMNPAGYLLLFVTFLAIVLEVFAFIKTILKNKKAVPALIGIFIILIGGIGFYLAFENLSMRFLPDIIQPSIQEMAKIKPAVLPLEESMQKMMDFMENNPGSVSSSLVIADQEFLEEVVLKSGKFVNVNYMTSGSASLVEKDGKNFLMFGDDFSTPNGPDLVVYFTKNSAPTSRDDIVQGIELTKLKSIKGKQVYELPIGIDVSQFNSVSIHCRAFNVPWSFAPLN